MPDIFGPFAGHCRKICGTFDKNAGHLRKCIIRPSDASVLNILRLFWREMHYLVKWINTISVTDPDSDRVVLFYRHAFLATFAALSKTIHRHLVAGSFRDFYAPVDFLGTLFLQRFPRFWKKKSTDGVQHLLTSGDLAAFEPSVYFFARFSRDVSCATDDSKD